MKLQGIRTISRKTTPRRTIPRKQFKELSAYRKTQNYEDNRYLKKIYCPTTRVRIPYTASM